MILIAEEKLTLIDTGPPFSPARIVGFIHNLGRSVEEIALIILTHNHFDHVGGLVRLKRLTQAKVAAHKADISNIDSRWPYPWLIRKLFRIPPFSALRPFLYVGPDDVDIQLTGGELLSPLGGLKVIHTPGHTPGSISLYSPQKKLLIAGDALRKRRGYPRLQYKMVCTDFRQALNSAKLLAQLEFDVVCFGHGRPITKDASAKVRALIEKH